MQSSHLSLLGSPSPFPSVFPAGTRSNRRLGGAADPFANSDHYQCCFSEGGNSESTPRSDVMFTQHVVQYVNKLGPVDLWPGVFDINLQDRDGRYWKLSSQPGLWKRSESFPFLPWRYTSNVGTKASAAAISGCGNSPALILPAMIVVVQGSRFIITVSLPSLICASIEKK